MGNTGCKPISSSQGGDKEEEDAEFVESVSIGKGIRVHQLEGNNFLGKLQDASRMSYRGQGLWRRHSSNAAGTPATGRGSTATGSSSARSSCYSDLSSGVYQQQQSHRHFLNTAPAATNGRTGSSSLDYARARAGGGGGGSFSPDNEESMASSSAAAAAAADASRLDLTTLLLQGFDPAAYEQRLAERRLAKFVRRPAEPPVATVAAATPDQEAPG